MPAALTDAHAVLPLALRDLIRLHAPQATLLAAKARFEAGQADQARAALEWLVSNGKDEAYRSIARLRLAGIDLDAGQFDAALRTPTLPIASLNF